MAASPSAAARQATLARRRRASPLADRWLAIQHGARTRDQCAIACLLAIDPLRAVWSAARAHGIRLPDPTRLVGRAYRCRGEVGLMDLPTGGTNFFWMFDRDFDPGVALLVRALQGGTFIDVGAGPGFFTLLAARRLGPRGRVLALEPHPVRRGLLERNIRLNGLHNVACVPWAAGDQAMAAILREPPFGRPDLDASLVRGDGRPYEVRVRPLDQICAEFDLHDVTLVKIDVDGWEPPVLRGMAGLLSQQRPHVVFEALSDRAADECAACLTPFGYVTRRLDVVNYLAVPGARVCSYTAVSARRRDEHHPRHR